MPIPWGLVTFLVGIVYGALKPGYQDKGQLFRQGLWIGIVLGIVLALIGFLVGAPALGLAGLLGAILEAIILSLLFILGVWIGDLITGAKRQTI